ncbi:MAG TPA: hypothetical protein VN639_07255, partial [Azonexus sp.]|nr:hypothetical protein [Azonexus sp.]
MRRSKLPGCLAHARQPGFILEQSVNCRAQRGGVGDASRGAGSDSIFGGLQEIEGVWADQYGA